MKKQATVELSSILSSIESASGIMDDLARQMLGVVKEAKASTLDAFNEMVSEVYAVNGWSQVAGRPSADSDLKPAPDAVKFYISNIRAAYRLKLDVLGFDTIGALRLAVKEVRAATRVPKDHPEPAVDGVLLTDGERMTGAVFHDLLVLRSNLPEMVQTKLDEECHKLLLRYAKVAPEILKLVA